MLRGTSTSALRAGQGVAASLRATSGCRLMSSSSSSSSSSGGGSKKPRGWFIGNKEKRVPLHKKELVNMSKEEKIKLRQRAKRMTYHDYDFKPLARNTVVVHANGATSIMQHLHPAGTPKIVLSPDITNHPAWASPKRRQEMHEEMLRDLERKGSDEQTKLVSKRGKRM
mmetsp:Transcript_1724/g.2712  ORF Transcript_1724/g.2712 Transcript_1724/m.2712 type:complete len:169 (+) Transcript_1724:92-598(+)